MNRRTLASLLVAILVASSPTAASAEGPGNLFGGLTSDGLTGSVKVPGAQSVSSPGQTEAGGAPVTSGFVSVSTGTPCTPGGINTGSVITPTNPLSGTGPGTPGFNDPNPQGVVYAQYLITGGQRSLISYTCGLAPPPPPPPPPSPAEIWGKVPLKSGTVGVSPPNEGITGMDTWFWYQGDASSVGLTVSIRGYSVEVRAKPVKFTWDSGDGAKGVARLAGSESRPGLTHVYETKGDYVIQMLATWEGSYTFSGYGVSSGGSLGSVSVTSTRPYHVFEIRSVLGP